MKYYATFTANNGSTYTREPYEFTNKEKAITTIKSLMKAEHFAQLCNKSTYCVWDENDKCVAKGALYDKGRWVKDEDAIGRNIDDV